MTPDALPVSVLIPTRRGGELAARVVARALGQRTSRRIEVLIVDSGSPEAELRELERLGARIERIEPDQFDHGATRDRAAELATGEILVFLNQDALPEGEDWLESLLRPFASETPPAAVQGAIVEFEPEQLVAMGRRRFYWDSCGPRFYFTRESEGWIAAHGGVGFSTVHCAISRWSWRALPFGPTAVLEDKKWQAEATRRNWRIDVAPDAVVRHTHDYDLGDLLRRCASEGFGWRLVGVRYSLGQALRDVVRRDVWREWWRGAKSGRLRRVSEVTFPIARPFALWWGNRWGRRTWA